MSGSPKTGSSQADPVLLARSRVREDSKGIRLCHKNLEENEDREPLAKKTLLRSRKKAQMAQRGEAATTLECADLTALSAGDLSPSNAEGVQCSRAAAQGFIIVVRTGQPRLHG